MHSKLEGFRNWLADQIKAKGRDMSEDFHLKGTVMLELQRADGSIETRRKDNLIVNGGFDFICDAIGLPAQPTEMNYIAVGTSTTAAAATQTALIAETARGAATYAHTAGTKVFTLTATFAAGTATAALTEAAVLNASSAGIMLDRVVFSVINKGADDTLTATFQFTLS